MENLDSVLVPLLASLITALGAVAFQQLVNRRRVQAEAQSAEAGQYGDWQKVYQELLGLYHAAVESGRKQAVELRTLHDALEVCQRRVAILEERTKEQAELIRMLRNEKH